jgi:hypothetical protein
MPTSVRFNLSGAGWADLQIIAGDERAIVSRISYCSDALDDLLRMGIDIATDKGFGAAIFDHEPALSALVAETAWIERNEWRFGARLSMIRDIPHFVTPSFKWRASVQANFVVHVDSRDELARLFLDAALRIRQEHGEEGYHKLWGGRTGYPRRAVAALEAALATAPGEVEPYG